MNQLNIIRRVALGLGIMVVLPFAFHWGFKVIYPLPNQPSDYHQKPKDKERYKWQERKNAWEQKVDDREKTYFYSALAAGMLMILLGAFGPPALIGEGFILGGVFILTMGYLIYWHKISDLFIFISLLAALALMVAVGYVLFGKKS